MSSFEALLVQEFLKPENIIEYVTNGKLFDAIQAILYSSQIAILSKEFNNVTDDKKKDCLQKLQQLELLIFLIKFNLDYKSFLNRDALFVDEMSKLAQAFIKEDSIQKKNGLVSVMQKKYIKYFEIDGSLPTKFEFLFVFPEELKDYCSHNFLIPVQKVQPKPVGICLCSGMFS